MDIPPNLSQTQQAVSKLLLILYEYSHLLDDVDIHTRASTLLETLYYIGPYNVSIKAEKIEVLKQKYGNDPFNTIIPQLMAIFDTDPDKEHPNVVFKPGMGDNNYITAMNSLKYLYHNRIHFLPVNLPESLLPPKTPNKWVQKEDELMDNMVDAFKVAPIIEDAKSAADLPLPLQDYRRILTDGIVKFKPLFEHAKGIPGMIDFYGELKKDLEKALKKIQEWSKEQPRHSPVKSAARGRSRSPIQPQPRRSKRLQTKQKNGGLRKIKTVRKFNKRNKPNNHNKPKSRRG